MHAGRGAWLAEEVKAAGSPGAGGSAGPTCSPERDKPRPGPGGHASNTLLMLSHPSLFLPSILF